MNILFDIIRLFNSVKCDTKDIAGGKAGCKCQLPEIIA